MTIKIGIHGASGRMGTAVIQAVSKNNNFTLAATFASSNEIAQLGDFCFACDVIIDFSTPFALAKLLENAISCNKNILIGTTGLSSDHFTLLEQAASSIAVLHAPNTSIGANLLIEMAGRLGKILANYDAEIVDLHHRHKKDAPSGTALAIGKTIATARSCKFDDVAVLDRMKKGARQDDEIGFSSLRAGGVWGEHEVLFASDSEVITIGARALSRSVFADGALLAAKWLFGKKPGLYSMQDVLEWE